VVAREPRLAHRTPWALVAGVGNKYMDDDGFGPRVVEALDHMELPAGIELRDVGLCGLTLAPDLNGYEVVVFVDAVSRGDVPGTLYFTEIDINAVESINIHCAEAPLISLHEVGIEELLAFARSIGTLPKKVAVLMCEIGKVDLGEELTPEVESSVERAAFYIREWLERQSERR